MSIWFGCFNYTKTNDAQFEMDLILVHFFLCFIIVCWFFFEFLLVHSIGYCWNIWKDWNELKQVHTLLEHLDETWRRIWIDSIGYSIGSLSMAKCLFSWVSSIITKSMMNNLRRMWFWYVFLCFKIDCFLNYFWVYFSAFNCCNGC